MFRLSVFLDLGTVSHCAVWKHRSICSHRHFRHLLVYSFTAGRNNNHRSCTSAYCYACSGGASYLLRGSSLPNLSGPLPPNLTEHYLIRYVKKHHITDITDIKMCGVLSRRESSEIVFGRGYGPDPTGRAYDAPRPLVG